jgi:AhpD family alkylhydroperoxidase
MTVRIAFPNVPKNLIAAMMHVENYVNACGFNMRLLELLRLHASQINGCAYCIDMHYKEAIAAGETPMRLYSLSVWRGTDFYDAQEQAALAWCEAITAIHENNPTDELFGEMQRHFKDSEIANLTLAITQINSWIRLSKSFGFAPGHYEAGRH